MSGGLPGGRLGGLGGEDRACTPLPASFQTPNGLFPQHSCALAPPDFLRISPRIQPLHPLGVRGTAWAVQGALGCPHTVGLAPPAGFLRTRRYGDPAAALSRCLPRPPVPIKSKGNVFLEKSQAVHFRYLC